MRRRVLAIATGLTLPMCLLAQSPQPAPETATSLPIRRVVLYKTGVGYFEHLGRVQDRQDVAIRFTSSQLNDVLKSLTAIDLGKGQITGISYNSIAPMEQRLGALRLPLDSGATTLQLLESLRGARVDVTSGASVTTGRLLSVETQQRASVNGNAVVTVETFSVITDAGELRTFDLTPAIRIRIAERDLRQEVSRYLDVVGSARERDIRTMVISTRGTGDRPLFVSYVSEVPIWKSTYRLVLPERAGKPLLQGWAIVDNTIGEDWTGVELSLVAGAPQTFIQHVSQPYYGQRPVVPLPRNVLMTPQTHQATASSGQGFVTGRVTDPSGSALPGVSVEITGPSGTVARATTDASGNYQTQVPPGIYRLQFSLSGFASMSFDGVAVSPGDAAVRNATLRVGTFEESVAVSGLPGPARVGRGAGRGVGAGVAGGVAGGIPAPPPPPPPPAAIYQQMRSLEAAASAGEIGDLFEYRIKEPVTLRKNQSALVPIVNTEISAEKVSLWTQGASGGRPLRAVWITNASGLTLDGGSISIIDGDAFAGEGLIEPVKAGERRLVSYATDLAMNVTTASTALPSRIFRVRARDGIVIQDSEERSEWTYTARNEDTTPRTLIVEHRQRPGWKLAEGQKPDESSAGAYRFRLVVEPRKEAVLVVREVRAGETRISLGDVDDALIARLAASGVSAADLERALQPVLDRRSAVAALERRMQELEQRRETIAEDQERVRENMKALRGSSEEKQLLQRYTRQLDEQENELESIRREQEKLEGQIKTAREELAKAINGLTFDLSGR